MAAVPIYWLDTNVFIQAKNGPYKFKVFGVFWAFLHEQIEAGTIRCPKMVYQEIVNNEEPRDNLANWIKTRRQSGLFVDPNADVQNAMTTVADHVIGNSAMALEIAWISSFRSPAEEAVTRFARLWPPRGVQVGSGVSEVQAAFWANLDGWCAGIPVSGSTAYERIAS